LQIENDHTEVNTSTYRLFQNPIRYIFVICLLLFCSAHYLWSQVQPDSTGKIKARAKIENGDTIIISYMDDIDIFADTTNKPKPVFENKRQERKFNRLVYNLKKVYPYAKLAKTKLNEMNRQYLTLKTEKERKEFAKKTEKEIRDQFEQELVNLTVTQGRLLIKLIDRETGKTSYELVKEFRGTFSAIFWQTLARLFGSNLKTKYDAEGEDQVIEDILLAIDAGMI
jgi:hypothetical protein